MHNSFGTIVATVHILLPFMVLPLYSTMQKIPRDLMQAGASLGGGPCTSSCASSCRCRCPGCRRQHAGIRLCLGFYITPELLGGGRTIMVSMVVSRNVELYNHWGAASAVGVVLLVCVRDFPHRRPRDSARTDAGAEMKMIPRFRIAWSCVLLVLLYLMLPMLIIVPMSFSGARFLTFPPPSLRCAGITNSSAILPGSRRPASRLRSHAHGGDRDAARRRRGLCDQQRALAHALIH